MSLLGIRIAKILVLFLPLIFLNVPGISIEQEKIVEQVSVTNIEVAVRAFYKNKPVTGLKKEDFKLFVNGNEREINGFFEYRNKIETLPTAPRVFLLIFNICDYHLDISSAVDYFFDKIIRPNDRLMVISRNFFFESRKIVNSRLGKIKLKRALEFETAITAAKVKALELKLKSLLRYYENQTKKPIGETLIELINREVIFSYMDLVREFKTLYLNIKTDKYVQLAHYLKEQKGRKWVLSFYQVGRFYKPKINSTFRKLLTSGEFMFSALKEERLRSVLDVEDKLPHTDLSKLFVDSGATFHTILMQDGSFLENDLAGIFSYTPIISDSYNLLKNIAKRTGSTFLHTNKTEKFYKEIVSKEDIYYVLTYEPHEEENKKKTKIKVIVDNRDYRIVYDNQKRSRYVRKFIKKIKFQNPHIKIDHIDFNDKTLSFIVSNFKIPKHKSGPAKPVKIPVRLQVFNRKEQNLYDGVEMFELTETGKGKVRLKITFPQISPGLYDFFVWVGDPLTGKNDLSVKEVYITGPAN